MKLVYDVLSSSPYGCVEFYGVSILQNHCSGMPSDTVCLVFEKATSGTIVDFLTSEQAKGFEWQDIVGLFGDLAGALSDGLHANNIVHRFITYAIRFLL